MQRNYDLEEQRYLDAHHVAYAANRIEPSEELWGIESYGGSHLGGYFGVFFWFSSKEDLLYFTGKHLPFMGAEIGCDDPFDGAEKVAAVIEAVKSGSMTWDEGRVGITNLLTKDSEIRWWGQLKDLFHDDSEFAQELRAWSRSSGEEISEDTSPIPDDGRSQFINILGGYTG